MRRTRPRSSGSLPAAPSFAPLPLPVMEACFKAAQEVYAEVGKENLTFKKIHDHMTAFQKDQVLWQSVTEGNFDRFMQSRKL